MRILKALLFHLRNICASSRKSSQSTHTSSRDSCYLLEYYKSVQKIESSREIFCSTSRHACEKMSKNWANISLYYNTQLETLLVMITNKVIILVLETMLFAHASLPTRNGNKRCTISRKCQFNMSIFQICVQTKNAQN